MVKVLLSYLDTDKSKIVKVFSMQTLADLAEKDELIRPKVVRKIEEILEMGSPAIVSRAKKLLPRLKKQ